jgi:hypothetical protein
LTRARRVESSVSEGFDQGTSLSICEGEELRTHRGLRPPPNHVQSVANR